MPIYSPLAVELAETANAYRRTGARLARLATIADKFAEIDRQLDLIEANQGLRRYIAAGGRLH